MNLTNHQRLTLFATSISYVVVVLDTSIVNVALTRISQGLGVDVNGLQWIVNAYVVIFASLLLTGGALGDMFGARKIYMLGLALFTASSLLCGCAPTLPLLIAGRILQGVGASLLVPCSLSLLTHAYPDAKERAKAIASWASWGGAALVLGPLAGGALLAAFDWRSIFLVNVPIGLLGIWLTLKTVSPVDNRGSRRLDLLGQMTAATAMILVTAALIESSEYGYGDKWALGAFALAAVSALAFVVVERKARAPMLPLFLFANPVFSWICYIFMSGSAAFFGMLFVLSLYLQRVAALTPLQTGVALLPLSLCVMAGNIASARLSHRFDPMNLMFAGAAIRLVGFAGVALVNTAYSYVLIAPLLLLIGFGGGLGSPMSTSVFMSTVDRQYSGIASGVSRATGQIGSAIGVAIFGGFVADTHQIAQGMRMSAAISSVLTASIVLAVCYLFRLSRRAVY
ncbi:Multidrug resistance protein Stp (plasmid) [Burkholderia sp. AD24]|nr:Multidrug resistance protein Stp [Burkholderia sp. AD24]